MVKLNFCTPCGEKRVKEVKEKLEEFLTLAISNLCICCICEASLSTDGEKSRTTENRSLCRKRKKAGDESYVTVSLSKTTIKTEVHILEDEVVPNVGAFESVHDSEQGMSSDLRNDVKEERNESGEEQDLSKTDIEVNNEAGKVKDVEDAWQSANEEKIADALNVEKSAEELQRMDRVHYAMGALQPQIAEMIEIVDDPKMPLKCRRCSHPSREFRFMMWHLPYHLNEEICKKPYQCNKCCDEKFSILEKWTEHTKQYQCRHASCRVIRKSKDALKKHEKIHKIHKKKEVKAFQCKECNELFKTQYKLKIHRQKAQCQHGKNNNGAGTSGDSQAIIPIQKKKKNDDEEEEEEEKDDDKKEDIKIRASALAPELRKLFTDDSCQADELKCKYCDRSMRAVGVFLLHVSTHVDVDKALMAKPFQCQNCCNQKFETYYEWTTHVKPFKCDVPGCKLKAASRSKVRDHQVKTHALKKFPCAQCTKMFKTRYALNEHTKSMHDEAKRYTCSMCGKQYYNKGSLELHERQHRKEKPFHCECGKSYRTADQLKVHQMDHTGERPFVCEQCGFRTKTKRDLKVHQYIHSDIKPYQCEICGKQMTNQSWYKRHQQQHTGKGILKCQYCDKMFKAPDTRARHERTHPEWNGKRFACEVCGKDLITKHMLRRHMMIHTGEKPFACTHCSFRCNRADSLRIHQKQHLKADWKESKLTKRLQEGLQESNRTKCLPEELQESNQTKRLQEEFQENTRTKRFQEELQQIQEAQTAASWIVL